MSGTTYLARCREGKKSSGWRAVGDVRFYILPLRLPSPFVTKPTRQWAPRFCHLSTVPPKLAWLWHNRRGCAIPAPSEGIWGSLGLVVESSIKPSSILMLSRFCRDILMVNPSTVWSCLQQVEVTQLDLKLRLWEDKISPCGWVAIYKFVPKEAEIGTARRGLGLKPIPNISQFHLKSRLPEVQLEIHKKPLISFPPTPEVLTTTESKERIS